MEELKVVQEQLEEEVGKLKLEKEAAEEPERVAKEEHEKVCAYSHPSSHISHQSPRHITACVV